MRSNLSLSNERVAEAHLDGLKPPPIYETEITSDSIEGLGVPPKSLREQELRGGLSNQIAKAIQQMQGAAALTELRDAIKASQKKWTGVAGAIQQMQRRSAFTELTETIRASRKNWIGVADAIQDFKLQQASMLASFAEASEAAAMRRNQMHQLAQSLALAHPELAGVAAGGSPQSANQAPGVVSSPKWDDYIEYLIYYVPSVTKEWVRENPGTAIGILIGLLTWLVPPPQQWGVNKNENRNIDLAPNKVIVAPKVEVRKRPSSTSIITDTLYHNNSVEEVGREGPWVKIEYRDKVEGKMRTGWVLRHYVDQVKGE